MPCKIHRVYRMFGRSRAVLTGYSRCRPARVFAVEKYLSLPAGCRPEEIGRPPSLPFSRLDFFLRSLVLPLLRLPRLAMNSAKEMALLQ